MTKKCLSCYKKTENFDLVEGFCAMCDMTTDGGKFCSEECEIKFMELKK